MSLEALQKVIEELEPKTVSSEVLKSLKLMRTFEAFNSLEQLVTDKILDIEIFLREKELEEERKAEKVLKKKEKKKEPSSEDSTEEPSEPSDQPQIPKDKQ